MHLLGQPDVTVGVKPSPTPPHCSAAHPLHSFTWSYRLCIHPVSPSRLELSQPSWIPPQCSVQPLLTEENTLRGNKNIWKTIKSKPQIQIKGTSEINPALERSRRGYRRRLGGLGQRGRTWEAASLPQLCQIHCGWPQSMRSPGR